MQVVMAKQGEERKYCCSNEMEVVSDDKLKVTKREEAPTHYTLEIESFPFLLEILSKSRVDRYESPEFEVSGYKWRLILYPKGDEQRNEDGYISLYLEIMGTQNLDRAWEIEALLNFFVYNRSNNQYISFQDGRLKRFSAVKTEWGISRLLPLTEFIDTSKGYLSGPEGSCKFGVEVFFLKSEGNGERFCTIDKPKNNQFSWKIEKFSKSLETALYSKEFNVGDYKWKLHLYPKGVSKVNGKFLSIFLYLQDYQNVPSGSKMYVEFKIRINDQYDRNNSKNTEKTGNAWFSGFETGSAWGFPYFMKLADPKEGLTANDDLIVEAEISSMSMAKDLSPIAQEMPRDIDTPPVLF